MIDFLSFLRLLIFMAHFLPGVLNLLFHTTCHFAGAPLSGGATNGGDFQDVAVTYGRVAMTWMKTFEHSANFSYCTACLVGSHD